MTRYNRIYYSQYTINMKPHAPPPLSVQNELAKELQAKGVFTDDLQLSSNGSTGQAALTSQLQTQAPLTFFLALFLAYLVMGAQFNSWRYPIYLLLPVPLALVGALFVVFLKGSVSHRIFSAKNGRLGRPGHAKHGRPTPAVPIRPAVSTQAASRKPTSIWNRYRQFRQAVCPPPPAFRTEMAARSPQRSFYRVPRPRKARPWARP